jgi:hypothetical protein
MRLAVTLLLASLLFGCKKEKTSNGFKEPFSGTWEYEKHIGFFTDSLPPGNGRILDLSSNGIFESRQHDTVLFEGVYEIKQKTDCSPRENTLFFSTNDTAFIWDGYIAIKNGRLTLSTSNCLTDGGTTFYRKVGASRY